MSERFPNLAELLPKSEGPGSWTVAQLDEYQAAICLNDTDVDSFPLWFAERAEAAIASLRQQNERLREELRAIAQANPAKWDTEFRGQFREWAQNRARHALAALASGEGGER